MLVNANNRKHVNRIREERKKIQEEEAKERPMWNKKLVLKE